MINDEDKTIYENLRKLQKKYSIKILISIIVAFCLTAIVNVVNNDGIMSFLIFIIFILFFLMTYYAYRYNKCKKEISKYCPYCFKKGYTTVTEDYNKIKQYLKWGNLIEEWQTTCKNECCGTTFKKNWELKIKKGNYCPFCYCHTKEFTTTTLYNKKIRSYVKKEKYNDSNGNEKIKRILYEDWEGQYRNECCGQVYQKTWQEKIDLD